MSHSKRVTRKKWGEDLSDTYKEFVKLLPEKNVLLHFEFAKYLLKSHLDAIVNYPDPPTPTAHKKSEGEVFWRPGLLLGLSDPQWGWPEPVIALREAIFKGIPDTLGRVEQYQRIKDCSEAMMKYPEAPWRHWVACSPNAEELWSSLDSLGHKEPWVENMIGLRALVGLASEPVISGLKQLALCQTPEAFAWQSLDEDGIECLNLLVDDLQLRKSPELPKIPFIAKGYAEDFARARELDAKARYSCLEMLYQVALYADALEKINTQNPEPLSALDEALLDNRVLKPAMDSAFASKVISQEASGFPAGEDYPWLLYQVFGESGALVDQINGWVEIRYSMIQSLIAKGAKSTDVYKGYQLWEHEARAFEDFGGNASPLNERVLRFLVDSGADLTKTKLLDTLRHEKQFPMSLPDHDVSLTEYYDLALDTWHAEPAIEMVRPFIQICEARNQAQLLDNEIPCPQKNSWNQKKLKSI